MAFRPSCRWAPAVLLLAVASGRLCADPSVAAPTGESVPPPAAALAASVPNSNIFDPDRAPIIVIHIGGRLIVLVPRNTGSSTTIGAQAIEREAGGQTNLTSIIAHNVAGVAAAPSGEIHIRGSHGQYSYYLDGVPLPTNVTGSFTDLINPKDIESLKVYTGGFPAQYGGQLAAVFDITAKAGAQPGGQLQQLVSGYSTYQTTAEYGGANKSFAYFVSGVYDTTHDQLSPETQTPLHAGADTQVGFGKFDYQAGANDRLTLDSGITGAYLQVPNDPSQQALNDDDIQKENTAFNNLVWSHTAGEDSLRLALYEHESAFRYIGDPGPDKASDQGSTTNENELATYLGAKSDYGFVPFRRNHFQVGFDVNTLSGHQDFFSFTPAQPAADGQPPVPAQTIDTASSVTGSNKSAYVQDTWTPGRFSIDYGARYDIYQAPGLIASQLSPRLNIVYNAGHDKLHFYYDRLFQPVPAEDVINLSAQGAPTAPAQPERDHFFEVGWEHDSRGTTESVDAYYRAEKNTVDDSTIGATQIDVPVNFAKGYARGVEFSVDDLSPSLSYYANYARSWAQGAGPIIGGLFGDLPLGYFYVDHDQTESASFGISYKRGDTFADFDGEYGSGFPYGQNPLVGTPTTINYIFTHPHETFDTDFGTRAWTTRIGTGQIELSVSNIFNHAYIIKFAGAFSGTQWAPGRTFGVKLTQNF